MLTNAQLNAIEVVLCVFLVVLCVLSLLRAAFNLPERNILSGVSIGIGLAVWVLMILLVSSCR